MEQLEGKLVESLEAKELGSLTADYTELGLDSILDDGIVKDIPILRTLVGLAKIGLNVRDRIYVKKIYGFLVEVGQTTQEQRDEFVEKHCGNGKRFEEAVLLILEQSDRVEKSALIGKVFKACILGKITYMEAVRLSDMLNRAFWVDLNCLIDSSESPWQRRKLYLAGFYDYDANSTYAEVIAGDLKIKQNYYTDAIRFIANGQYDKLDSLTSPTEQG